MEDHEVVHNMMYDAKTNLKVPHLEALTRSEWWDNGVLPLWITAQNQVRPPAAQRWEVVEYKYFVTVLKYMLLVSVLYSTTYFSDDFLL